MEPEKFLKRYESALATQDWGSVSHPISSTKMPVSCSATVSIF